MISQNREVNGLMQIVKIKKGLNLPIKGAPKQEILDSKYPQKVAILGDDYVGMKPTMNVQVGDRVKKGQLLFSDKKTIGVKYTSPGCGKVIEINRGEKRHFQSIVIELEGEDEITFKSFPADKLASLKREEVVENLVESGLWTSIRSRPFGKVADPSQQPKSIFVNCMDTNPLAPSVPELLKGREDSFRAGLQVINHLNEGTLFLVKAPGDEIPQIDLPSLQVAEFSGPHPAGLVGTHIHFLSPASKTNLLWYINAQDLAAIGDLFLSGKLNMDKVIAIGGPGASNPRLIRTRYGACVSELMKEELKDDANRLISGSVFSGTKAQGPFDFLGKFDQQISVISDSSKRRFLGWVIPPMKTYSVKNLVPFKFNDNYEFNTEQYGGLRPVVPIGSYEKVMPLDIIPSYLLRALAVDDVEESEGLGCLELVEEDLALCTYVCPSKIDHGANLRRVLTIIEKEG